MDPVNLLIIFNDGTKTEVSANAADLVAFESKFDMSVSRLSSEIRLTHLLFIAWHVQHRLKTTAFSFDEWVDTVSMVTEADSKK